MVRPTRPAALPRNDMRMSALSIETMSTFEASAAVASSGATTGIPSSAPTVWRTSRASMPAPGVDSTTTSKRSSAARADPAVTVSVATQSETQRIRMARCRPKAGFCSIAS
jgi:hypothetical protein